MIRILICPVRTAAGAPPKPLVPEARRARARHETHSVYFN
jgi:hypothetical protein